MSGRGIWYNRAMRNIFAMTAGLGMLGLGIEALAAVTVSMEPMTLPTYPYGDPDPAAASG